MSFVISPGVVQSPLTAGGIAYANGTTVQVTSAGIVGQVLVSNGSSTPTFQTFSGGTTMLFAGFSQAL